MFGVQASCTVTISVVNNPPAPRTSSGTARVRRYCARNSQAVRAYTSTRAPWLSARKPGMAGIGLATTGSTAAETATKRRQSPAAPALAKRPRRLGRQGLQQGRCVAAVWDGPG